MRTKETPIVSWLKTMGACAVAAILLEAGTVFGSPGSSVLLIEDWSKRRLVIFFAMALGACAAIHVMRKNGRPIPDTDEVMRGRIEAALRWLAVFVGAAIVAELLYLTVTVMFDMGVDLRPSLFVFTLIVSISLCVADRIAGRFAMERCFLYIALPFGILYCICMPAIASAVWDGQIHFDRTLAESYVQGAQYTPADRVMTNVLATEALGIQREGSSLPQANLDAASVDSANDELVDLSKGSDVLQVQGASCLSGDSVVTAASVGYLPSAFALWISRLLHLPVLLQYLLGRLGNLFFYCFMFYCSIKQLRSGKLIVFALGLFPTVFLMACNYHYDPWSLSLMTYSFSKFVSIVQAEGAAQLSDVAEMLAAFVLGALVRAVLFPMALFFLFMPRDKVRYVKHYSLLVVLAALMLLSSFAIPFLAGGGGSGDLRGGNVNPSGQVALVLANPAGYLGRVAEFTVTWFLPQGLDSALLAPYLRDLNPLEVYCSYSEFALLLALALYDRDESHQGYATPAMKAAVFVGVVCAYLLVVTALYVSFTPVGSSTIIGVQVRYMAAGVALVALVGFNFKRLCRPRKRLNVVGSLVLVYELLMLSLVFFGTFLVYF